MRPSHRWCHIRCVIANATIRKCSHINLTITTTYSYSTNKVATNIFYSHKLEFIYGNAVCYEIFCSGFLKQNIMFLSLLNFPHTPGGYSQWQSQTVARREGKCRAPANNQFIYMITRPEIGFTDRPRNIRNPSYTILLRTWYYIICLEYQGANKSVKSNHCYID